MNILRKMQHSESNTPIINLGIKIMMILKVNQLSCYDAIDARSLPNCQMDLLYLFVEINIQDSNYKKLLNLSYFTKNLISKISSKNIIIF